MADPEEGLRCIIIMGKVRKGRPWSYPSREALQAEITSYFEFVIERRIAVSVAGLSAWLGISTATLRLWKSNMNTMPFYDVVEPAVAFIHAMTEQGALDGNVPAVPFMFLAKNYHSLHDKLEYEIKSSERLSLAEQEDIISFLPE